MTREEIKIFRKELAANMPNTRLRRGQIVFNALYEAKPEWADEIRGSDKDPFYCDSNLGAFGDWFEGKMEAE